MVHIYNVILLLLAIKKEWNNAILSNMNGFRDYHTEWSKSKTNIIWYHLLLCSHLICVWLCDPMDYSTLVFSVLRYLLEFAQIHVHWVGDANCLILCSLLLLLPSIFPSIRVFSNDITYMLNLKYYTNEFIYKIKTHSQKKKKKTYGYQRRKKWGMGGGIK